eukprot:CAMPEP_0205938616 /NCGR_PEP_ID=MMETSP1325-20131115/47439_1 /ASSEMBLY_ACC=CAM_ASM_000708 /TAXON_ID=236786 /ORGANISM="Florenciella sp., Strain RCC1007" /LENGTH=116 /DNA_ID=CAMNT_0053308973 /DNA_START=18 /DNA_END=368 /DNA_ORIENTATION=+
MPSTIPPVPSNPPPPTPPPATTSAAADAATDAASQDAGEAAQPGAADEGGGCRDGSAEDGDVVTPRAARLDLWKSMPSLEAEQLESPKNDGPCALEDGPKDDLAARFAALSAPSSS